MSEYPETKEAETTCADLLEAVLALRLDGQRGMPLTDFIPFDLTAKAMPLRGQRVGHENG